MLGEQASYQVSLRHKKDLIDIIQSNENLISDNILSSSKLSQSIKTKIESYREEIKNIILATAAHIEKGKFQDVEKLIESIRTGENEKRQIKKFEVAPLTADDVSQLFGLGKYIEAEDQEAFID